MKEIEKMYKNAEVKPTVRNTAIGRGYYIEHKRVKEYPPFTPEKQLNVLKIIVHSFGFNSLDKPIWDKGWDIAIAKLVNFYWEVLSEEERKQIKEILE